MKSLIGRLKNLPCQSVAIIQVITFEWLSRTISRIVGTTYETNVGCLMWLEGISNSLKIKNTTAFVCHRTLSDDLELTFQVCIHLEWYLTVEYSFQIFLCAIGDVFCISKRMLFCTDDRSSYSTAPVTCVMQCTVVVQCAQVAMSSCGWWQMMHQRINRYGAICLLCHLYQLACGYGYVVSRMDQTWWLNTWHAKLREVSFSRQFLTTIYVCVWHWS